MEVSQDRLNGLVEKYASNACTKGELDELLMIIQEERHKTELEMAFRSYWEKVGEFDNLSLRRPGAIRLPIAIGIDNERWDRLFVEMMEGVRSESLSQSHEGALPSSRQATDFATKAQRHEGNSYENTGNIATLPSSGQAPALRHEEGNQELELNNGRVIKWRKFTVAAVIIGLLGFGIWFVSNQQSTSGDQPVAIKNDVQAPDKTRATIKLADGRVVMLDEVGSGELALQGNVKVVKGDDGAISYEQGDSHLRQGYDGRGEIIYNTLFNPRGSKVIDIRLADGSRIWLNAGSSITYPVAFVGNVRKVSIEGEAYFEISKVSSEHSVVSGKTQGADRTTGGRIPFLVQSGEVVTEVLGTHFNVNSYGDDGMIKVTLLEGSVRVKPPAPKGEDDKPSKGVILRPGQSVFAPIAIGTTADAAIQLHSNIDIEEVMAWKNGMFSFNRTDVRMIMKQLERWYDVEVVYEGNMDNIDFTGGIARKENVSQVLKMLETTGVVDFKIEGKKIVVRRK